MEYKRIGGSRAAAVLAQSKWATPLDVYLECRGESDAPANAEELTADQERGVMLEPALLTWASRKLGLDFKKPPESIPHPTLPFASVSPDGLASDGTSYLELKAPRSHEGWGAEGTDDVPQEYLLQVVHGLMVTDRKVAYIGALLGGTLKLFKYERDVELEQMVRERERLFWEQHVLAGVPPAPTYGDEGTLRKRWPHADSPPLSWTQLSDSAKEAVNRWADLTKRRRELEKAEDELRVAVLDIIGPHAGIGDFPPEHPVKRIDAKNNKPGPSAGTWKAVSDELLAQLSPEAGKALINKHTPKDGPRVLRAYRNKEEP